MRVPFVGYKLMVKDTHSFECVINRLIVKIDILLNKQVNEVLHHAQFQSMEASWRGIFMLTRQTKGINDIKIRILDISLAQLMRDIENSSDFDQSHLFNKIYSKEFDMPGGEPLGLLVGDYIFPDDKNLKSDSISCLSAISAIAAAAFCPFIAGASPVLIGVDHFGELSRTSIQHFPTKDIASSRWASLRRNSDARFIGLIAPRILMRKHYKHNVYGLQNSFIFRETLDENAQSFVWGNGAYAFAMVVLRSFIETGWFTDIRGPCHDHKNGGHLGEQQLPLYDMHYETAGLSAQAPIETRLTTTQEQTLCELGLIPLVGCHLSASVVFNSNQSLYTKPHYGSAGTEENARLSGMLQYVLCVSRFAHYIKMIMREKIGYSKDAATVEREIQNWISDYTLNETDIDSDLQSKYPLRNANVRISDALGCPGLFICKIEMQPHFQVDSISFNFELTGQPHVLRNFNHGNSIKS